MIHKEHRILKQDGKLTIDAVHWTIYLYNFKYATWIRKWMYRIGIKFVLNKYNYLDPNGYAHNHRQDFVSFILKGFYIEYTETHSKCLMAPSIIFRKKNRTESN